jgi:uncharacterized protein (DUF2141 family)
MNLSPFSLSRFLFGFVLALTFAGAVLAPPAYAQSDASGGTVSFRVVGLESDDGSVRAALNNQKNYDDDGSVRAAALSIEDGTARWTIEGVPPGTYAVRLYHDENDNGELDTNMFGVPQEPFGFSNDARGSMGPPDFDEAAFTVASDSLSMTITAE